MVLKYLLLDTYFGEALTNFKNNFICNTEVEHKNVYVGLIGSSLLLIPHALNSFDNYYHHLHPEHYNPINFIGSSMLSYYSYNNSNYPLFLFSTIWGLTSFISIVRDKIKEYK